MTSVIAIDRLENFVRVQVGVGDGTYSFLLDTGIGITVVSSAIAGRPDVVPTDETFSGRGSSPATPTRSTRIAARSLSNPRRRRRSMESWCRSRWSGTARR